jgi:hypothetical protein
MFKYIINGEEVTFNDIISRDAALAEASEKGYSVEAVEFSSAPEEKDPILASIEANTPKEDFTQGPVESADAASETVAQDDTELLLDDGSTELPSGEAYSIDGKPVTKKEFEAYDAEVKADKPLELTLSAEEMEANDEYWKEQEKSFLRQQAAEMEFSEKLKVDWYKGNLSLGEMLSSIPETIYDIFAIPQNIIADTFDIPSLKATSDTAKETFGIENSVLNYYIAEQEKLGEVQAAYNEANYSTTGISANFSEGNYEDGFKQLASGLIESAPISLAMMAGGAAATTGQLVAGSTVAFAGPEIREQREKSPEQSELATMAKSLGLAAAESVFSSVGTGTIGKVYKDIILKEGTKKGSVIFKEGLVKMYQAALTKYGAPASMVGEGVEEVATTITQNMINGKNPFENVTDSFIQGIGGGFAFGAPINAAKLKGALDQGITDFKIKKQLNDSDFNNVIEAFTPGVDINSSVINISQVNGSLEAINKKADKEVINGNITQDQANAVKKNAAVIQGAAASVERSNVSEADKSEAVELLTERNRLQGEIKAIGDKALSAPQELRLKTVNELLGKLVKKGTAEKAAVSTKAAKKIISQIGDAKFTEAKNRAEIDEIFKKINESDSEGPDVKYDNQYGLIVERADGSTEIIINQEETFKDGIVNTAAHEVLHFALQNTLKSTLTEGAQIQVGDALIDFLETIEKDTNLGAFENRFLDYIDAFKKGDIKRGDLAEEAITVLSEAMLNGQVKYTETLGTKLMDFGRRLASALGYKAKFNTGQDVFNFIRDYNRSIEKGGTLSKGLKKSIKKGIKGKLTKDAVKAQKAEDAKKAPSVKMSAPARKAASIEALTEAYFDLQDQAAEDPNNLALYERMEKAGDALDAALAAPTAEATADVEAVQEAPKEVIVRPKADKSKRKYSIDKEIKKELEPKIAEAQKLNKELIAKEKKLNADAIAEIEAIDDKVESRTSREKRIADLKNKPLTVSKPDALNKLEREITAALETPINKAVNIFTRLYYDKIAKNATAAVTRDEFMQSAKAEITSLTINEFKPETINRLGEEVINDIEDIIFQRGGLRLRNLAQRLGVISKEQGIARGADALTKIAAADVDTSFDANDTDSVLSEEKRKVSALLASESRYDQAREQIQEFWKENEGNTKVENFKKLPNLINNILAEMFGVTESTLAARSGNLNKQDYRNAIKAFTEKQAVFTIKEGNTKKEVRVPISEVGAFQDKLNEQRASNKDFSYKREANESIAEALIRFLPKTSADDYTYASGRKGRFSGKSTGLPKNLLELAYKVEGRKTTGIGNIERAAQKLTIEEIYDAIGASVDADGNVVQKPSVSGRSKEGQTLLGLIKLVGRMVTNEISRTETDLDPMTKEDIAAGKNRMMFSLKMSKRSEVLSKANKDIENLKRVIDIPSANIYINDVKDLIGILDSPDLKVVNKTIFSSRSKLIAANIMRNNSEISEADARKEGEKITDYIKNELDKLKEEGILNKRKTFGTTTASMQFPKAKFGGYVFAIDSGALDEQNKNHAEVMRKSYTSIYEDIAKAKESNNEDQLLQQVALWARFTEAASMERTHFLAMGAANIGYEAGLTSKDIKAFEHAFPVADMGGKLLAAALDSDSKKEFIAKYNDLVKNYVIIGLSKENANKVGKAGYNSTMPEGANFWWQRYLNEAVAAIDGGINPHNVFIRNDKGKVVTLSEYAGWVDNAGKPLTKKLKEFYQKQAKAQPKISRGNIKLMPKNLQVKVANVKQSLSLSENFDKAMDLGNSLDQETKGISVWDFDDTLAKTKSSVLYTMPDGTTGKLDAAEFAKKGDAMLAEGAEFDFSEFSKVVKGEKGPFFEKAMARNKKFGNKNVFVLTARPANSALAIHEFLKGIGLDIPLANITGLANSDPQAKANWVLDKFAEGYNDFYFADDHIGNVNAVKKVLDVLDVKSKVQQARVKFSLDLSKRFNQIIEEESGIESFKEYQSVKAKLKGRKKGKFKFFIPPSAEDFLGLLYTTLPKGKKGESAMAFYKEHLLDPYGKAITGLRTGRITIGKNYRALKKELGIVPRKLKKTFKYEDENGNMKESLFTKEQAIRVYTWDAQGFEIPGLSNVDLPILVNYVNANPDLKAFADKLLGLNKNTKPKAPTESWPAGTITSDLLNTLNTEGRAELLGVWQQNVDAIFTDVNLNKLEAAYGESYVRALKDSLRRMKTGRNAKPTGNTVTDGIVKWINAAVGNIMFLNRRSAALQLISFTNFINFEGNNIYQAGKAFANQKQYWKDWTMLMNSDYLVDRRDGLRINVNEADIATTAKENGFQGVLAKILQVGFIPTKMADTAAIATGGATFYRNRVNTYLNDKTINGTGYTLEQAEKQAMQDFISTAETSQQSSDPSKISKQQAEPIGRIILAFANTPSQYARIIKRSAQDLKNGRGDAKTHLSRIVYYGLLQNLIFNFLQQAMFTALMGDEDDEDLTEKQEESRNKKMLKTANSMTDGILRGIGVGGAVVSAVKNLAIKFYERSQKTRNQRLAETLKDGVMAISPPISSKLNKIGRVGNSFEWGKKEMEFDDMSLKHPYVTIAANTVAAATGFPADRAVGMAIDAVDIASDETETWMKPLIALGWPKWQLMSEEATEKEREEKKERFKELKEDKEFKELNPTEQRRSVLKKLTKKEQIDILWNAGLSKTQIRKLTKEADRVDKIMGLQDKKQFDKDMEALSRGEDIEEMPNIERPNKNRKKSLK